jgi:hypothetical protein
MVAVPCPYENGNDTMMLRIFPKDHRLYGVIGVVLLYNEAYSF